MINLSLRMIRNAAIAFLVAGCLVGCGGPENIAQVSGTVTLDGQPLRGAYVIFNPVEPGSQSSGLTDDSGHFTLQYTREIRGAEIGDHMVRITTASRGDPDADPPKPKVEEKLPAKYHSKSELSATVKQGSNDLSFPLVSAPKSGSTRK